MITICLPNRFQMTQPFVIVLPLPEVIRQTQKNAQENDMLRRLVAVFMLAVGIGISPHYPDESLERIPIMLKHNLHVGNNWRILAV